MVKISVPLQRYWLRRRFLKIRRVFFPANHTQMFRRGAALRRRKPIVVEVFSNKHKDSLKDIKSHNDIQKTKNQRDHTKLARGWSKLQLGLLSIFSILSLTVMALLFAPYIYYRFVTTDPVPVKTAETSSAMGGSYEQGTKSPKRQVAQPAYDENLPEGTWLIIPRIGVRTEFSDETDSAVALSKGVWRVPDFGLPGDLTKPMILAAHRYGYQWWWRSDYWKLNSFYELPQLQPGDLVEVISGKRKYTYEIYAGEEGEDITDYNADLILYTCKFLNSPLRHFRYARLIDPLQQSAAVIDK